MQANQETTTQSSPDDLQQSVMPSEGKQLQVSIEGPEDEAILDNIRAFLSLLDLQDKEIENPSYVAYLTETGLFEIQKALQPYGYYQPDIELTTQASENKWDVIYRVDLGQPTTVASVDIQIKGDGQSEAAFITLKNQFPLAIGQTLLQTEYIDFKNDFTEIAVEKGYFDADFTTAEIRLSSDYLQADVTLVYDTGPRYVFAETSIEQDFLRESVFERYKTVEPGEVYSTGAIAELQRDLYNSGYVQLIDVTAQPDKENKTVPVTMALTPKKNKRHRFALGYDTDLGPRFQYEFDWRWVNRLGHQLTADFFISPEWQQTGFEYRIPAQKPATDYYKLFADVTVDKTDNRDSTLWELGGAYLDQIGHLAREFGVIVAQEDFSIGNDSANVMLLAPYVQLIYHKTDNPLNTRDGLAIEGLVTGTDQAISDISFLKAVARAKHIKRFAEQHKLTSKLALGKIWTDEFHQIPPSYRFFTGGDKTIRGYGFQSIGQRDSSGENIGGDNLLFASVEYSYFFKDTMAIAAFIDAGDAYTDDFSIKVGAGLGFHYYSPIGPIKIDLAHGFDETGDDIRLHLNIGPDL